MVHAAREQYGIDVVVLRLLGGELAQPPGGEVTYLAQVDAPVQSKRVVARTVGRAGRAATAPLVRASRRSPRRSSRGRDRCSNGHGMRMTAPPEQIRTWNLSSVWRLPVGGRLRLAQGGAAVHGARRTIAGRARRTRPCRRCSATTAAVACWPRFRARTCTNATPTQLIDMVSLLVRLQLTWVGRLDSLLALGLPDWRGAAVTRDIADGSATHVARTRQRRR